MYKIFDSNVTLFGGIQLMYQQLIFCGTIDFIDNQLGQRVKYTGYNYSDILLSCIYTSFCGGNATEDINYIRENTLKHLSSFKYQFGKYEHRIVAYRMPNKTGQISAFINGANNYLFIITNDWDISEEKAIDFYNKQGNSGQVFDIQNNDFNWNSMSHSFLEQNVVYLTIMVVVHIIYKF